MANLIIKSSADDLVLQGSDASPAITVGATGTLTFAENVTMSGTANNIGTTTAGTLSSGVTFPAGMVIGFGKAAGTGSPSGGTTATSYEQLDNAIITYTPKATGNILLLNASISSYLDNRSKEAYYTWYAGSTNISSTATNSGRMGLSTDHLTRVHEYGGSANDDFPIGGDVTGWWTAQNTNSTTFSVYWKAEDAVAHHVVVCTLMEIQA